METIRKTEDELEAEGWTYLQDKIWIQDADGPNKFKVIYRCPDCRSLILAGEQLLMPNATWVTAPCPDCTLTVQFPIMGNQTTIIKKEIKL